jgi:hypothetical protein
MARLRLIDPATPVRHVSIAQVAEYFNVGPATVRKWIDARLLEAFALIL